MKVYALTYLESNESIGVYSSWERAKEAAIRNEQRFVGPVPLPDDYISKVYKIEELVIDN